MIRALISHVAFGWKFYGFCLAVVALLGGGVVSCIRQDAQDEIRLEQAEEFIEGTQDAIDAISSLPDDDDAVLDGLRQAAGRGPR